MCYVSNFFVLINEAGCFESSIGWDFTRRALFLSADAAPRSATFVIGKISKIDP